MNTVLIWVILPIIFGLIVSFFQKWKKVSVWLIVIISQLLALTAYFFPKGLTLNLPQRQIVLNDFMMIFNRRMEITGVNLSFVGLIFSICFLWNIFSFRFQPSQWFPSISLVISALWVATLAVNPFLYGAVIVELIALVSIPILSPRGIIAQPGLIRFLIFHTISMPLILLTGWMLSGIETVPAADPLIFRATILVLLGFVFWLGVFPLNSWVNMLNQESHPWVTSFVLITSQTSLIIYLLNFFERYAWLRNLPYIFDLLIWVGAINIFAAGIFAAFNRKLSRIFALIHIAETGYSLIALGLSKLGGLNYLALLLPAKILAYWQLAFILSNLKKSEGNDAEDFENLHGFYHRYPFASLSLLVVLLNLLGMPMFALFPSKRMLWNLLPKVGFEQLPLLVVGILGMLLMILRLMHLVLLRDDSHPEPISDQGSRKENLGSIFFYAVMLLIVLVIGLFPHFFLSPFLDILAPFSLMVPSI